MVYLGVGLIIGAGFIGSPVLAVIGGLVVFFGILLS